MPGVVSVNMSYSGDCYSPDLFCLVFGGRRSGSFGS